MLGPPRRRTVVAMVQPEAVSLVDPSVRLAEEVRRLAAERDALILAHNYQVPEIQEVAHHVGRLAAAGPARGRQHGVDDRACAASTSWPSRPSCWRRTARC